MGLKRSAERGKSGLYSRPCYGYYKDKNGMLAIDEEKAEIVRSIFEWYLEGASIIGIKRRRESRNIKTPKDKVVWSKHTIETILINMKYTGDVAIVDSGNSERSYMIGDHHTGIISKEKFEAVQLEMAARSNVEVTENGIKRKSTNYSLKK